MTTENDTRPFASRTSNSGRSSLPLRMVPPMALPLRVKAMVAAPGAAPGSVRSTDQFPSMPLAGAAAFANPGMAIRMSASRCLAQKPSIFDPSGTGPVPRGAITFEPEN
jgi:hypothetical protein